MSIDWNVRMDTNKPAQDVIELLAKRFLTKIENRDEVYSTRVPESLISVTGENKISKISKMLMLESYKLNLKLDVDFADYRGRVEEKDEDNRIGKGIAITLKEVDGDAVVLFDGEITIAQRNNGELLVQDKEYEWLKEELDKAGLKYKKQRLPSPFVE